MLAKEKTKLKQGYTMHPVVPADLEAVVNLMNAFSQATMGVNEVTLDEVENLWQTPGVNIEEDLRLVTDPEGELVGYVESLAMNKPPVHPYLWLRLHPTRDDGNAGEALLVWALAHAARVLDTLPADLRVSVGTHNLSTFSRGHELFERFGLKPVRHSFIMHRGLPEAPPLPVWPEGITLRPFVVERDAKAVYLAKEEAFEDHFGHVRAPFEEGFAAWKHQSIGEKDYDPSLWFIAMDGNEIAGASLCRVNDGEEALPMGWVNSLSVRRPWRKRGLGSALLLHSFGEFYRRGFKKVGLGVDAGNITGALRIYERAGMYVARQYDRYEKELRPGRELMTTGLTD